MDESKLFIPPPKKQPFILRFFLMIAEKIAGRRLLPARILGWYPKGAFSSAVLESLVAHGRPDLPRRLLRIIRLRVSFRVVCPFCIGFNSKDWNKDLTLTELEALQKKDINEDIFTEKEKDLIRFTDAGCSTPLVYSEDLRLRMKQHFTPKQLTVIALTVAQVNYWARLVEGLGAPE